MFGGLIFEVDLVAHDCDFKALSFFALAKYGEVDLGSAFAADEFHNITQFHVDHVHGGLSVVLTNRDDFVFGLKKFWTICGSTRNDFFNDRITVLRAKWGANAFEREVHFDFEVFEAIGREIARVRIKCEREGVDKVREQILLRLFFEALGDQLITVNEAFLRFVEFAVVGHKVRNLKVNVLFDKLF